MSDRLAAVKKVAKRLPPIRTQRLEERVAQLEVAVAESQRLNERLADVLDVVTELLVPAVDRDEERLDAALAKLDKTVDRG